MTLAHADIGSGPALVLLHAFPLSRAMWRDVTAPLAAEGWRVITPDLPGFGESLQTATSMSDMASAVVELLDELGEHSVVIGGCSMGGYVALAFAERFPHRVGGLVLVDTKASADGDEARANRERVAQQVMAAGSTDALAAVMPGTLLGSTTQASRPELVAWVQQEIRANRPEGVAAAQRAMAARRAQFDTLSGLRVPVLCIRGAEDGIASAEDHAAMAAAAGDPVLVDIPDAGHLLPIERPTAFVAQLADFLRLVRHPHC